MKTALIGFGDIALKHLEVLESVNCEICGILTRNYSKASSKSKQFGIKKAYKCFEEIEIDKNDFFMVMVSPENNAKILRKLLPLKKPIFIEKPVAFSSQELDDIIKMQKKSS